MSQHQDCLLIMKCKTKNVFNDKGFCVFVYFVENKLHTVKLSMMKITGRTQTLVIFTILH